MPLPDLEPNGHLPPGIHAASLAEVRGRFGVGSAARQRQVQLLEEVVAAAREYATIKRVLVWGSFVTAKPEPGDLDYSVVVSVDHHRTRIAPAHRRFFVPVDARRYYGVDRNYLVIKDYPLDAYPDRLEFLCHTRQQSDCGIVEISIRGEFQEDRP
jgi:hypothetical protein